MSEDRDLAYQILHFLFEEIVVFTRPVEETDIIAGKKKDNQQIPHKLRFKLKLPQNILQDISNKLLAQHDVEDAEALSGYKKLENDMPIKIVTTKKGKSKKSEFGDKNNTW